MQVRLTDQAFDPGALLNSFSDGRAPTGAVVSFTGLCRADPGVDGLELEAYPGFTEAAITRFVQVALDRFDLQDTCVVHRVGLITPGAPIVFVAAAAVHRRAAFESVEFLMDWLKSRAPFWKKAHGSSGGVWIAPRAQDFVDAARWDQPEPEPTSA